MSQRACVRLGARIAFIHRAAESKFPATGLPAYREPVEKVLHVPFWPLFECREYRSLGVLRPVGDYQSVHSRVVPKSLLAGEDSRKIITSQAYEAVNFFTRDPRQRVQHYFVYTQARTVKYRENLPNRGLPCPPVRPWIFEPKKQSGFLLEAEDRQGLVITTGSGNERVHSPILEFRDQPVCQSARLDSSSPAPFG